ncbi:MAG: hypothetical protein ACJAZO_003367 [Myxococcota bacterium]|jgi:hypothetical protein
MTRGFYDQLGVEPNATPEAIREAYLRLVTQFRRRRQALIDRGGDPDRLELARSQADESYAVLSDPERRRRYDAMLALLESGIPENEDELWDEVEGAIVSEAVVAAVELLQHTTDIVLEGYPTPPGFASAPSAEPVPLTPSVVVELPLSGRPTPSSQPTLRVVDGANQGSPVIVMPNMQQPGISMPAPRLVASATPVPPPAPPEPQYPPGPPGIFLRLGPTGTMLSTVREHLDMSLEDLSEQTRIAVRFLQAIEEEAFDRLPSATFVRGYVREMATLMELDEDEVVEGYMERFHGAR